MRVIAWPCFIAVVSILGLSWASGPAGCQDIGGQTVEIELKNGVLSSDGKGGTTVVDPTLPAGVTLKQIDGGPNYYGANGLTNAHNAGWDNPNFFPIGAWAAPIQSTSDAARWAALGWNTAWVPAYANQSVIQSAGISLVISIQTGWANYTNYGFTPGPETVGIQTFDEPGTSAQFYNGMSTTPNSVQDGRFWWVNNTINWINGWGPSPRGAQGAWLAAPQTTPNGTTRHIDISSLDYYPFSRNDQYGPPSVNMTWGLSTTATPDQYRRGFLYGDIIDQERLDQIVNAPTMAIVENGGPFTTDTTAASYIQPAEMNWAVWQSIIHGARGIVYFNNTFGGPAISNDNMATAWYQNAANYPSGISMYAQTAATDALIEQLAPVLNSPFATGYATVSPASGEKLPLPLAAGTGMSAFNGIDISVRWYTGGKVTNRGLQLSNGAYIFAATRASESATNIPATFTLANHNASSVTVVNENRTIPVINGVFTDTFVTAATVHIYQVNDGTTSNRGRLQQCDWRTARCPEPSAASR
jgi:hypothetical protein